MASSIVSYDGSVPKYYDHYPGPFLFEPYALDLMERIKGKKLEHVLELACGTGRVTAYLINMISEQGMLIATDLNKEMIEVAKQKMKEQPVHW